MAINARGTFLGLKYVLPQMIEKRRGSVINIGSIASRRGLPGLSGFNASKHAMLGLSRAAASEVARYGVRQLPLCRRRRHADAALGRGQFGPDDPEGMLRAIELPRRACGSGRPRRSQPSSGSSSLDASSYGTAATGK